MHSGLLLDKVFIGHDILLPWPLLEPGAPPMGPFLRGRSDVLMIAVFHHKLLSLIQKLVCDFNVVGTYMYVTCDTTL